MKNEVLRRMPRLVALATVLCGAGLLRAESLPDGFVFRGGVTNVVDGSVSRITELTIRLYAEERSAAPLWTGVTNDVDVTDGVFQVWVSQALHKADVIGEDLSLETLFERGRVHYIGITFNGGAECLPRRSFMTAPLAHYAVAGGALDAKVSVENLWGVEDVSAVNAELGKVTCGRFVLGGSGNSVDLAVERMNVASATLYRDDDNAVFGPQSAASSVTNVWLRPGEAIHNRTGRAVYLTIRSADGTTVPCLSVPVPAGGSFAWPKDESPLECAWTMTTIGVE